MKINLAVLFGGRSVEHEVSVISAVQAMASMNKEKYNIIPVYMTKKSEFYTGRYIFTRLFVFIRKSTLSGSFRMNFMFFRIFSAAA